MGSNQICDAYKFIYSLIHLVSVFGITLFAEYYTYLILLRPPTIPLLSDGVIYGFAAMSEQTGSTLR